MKIKTKQPAKKNATKTATPCWLVIEDDDGLSVVGQAFGKGWRAASKAILAEMRQNSDLADEEGATRAWVLTLGGEKPALWAPTNGLMIPLRIAAASKKA